jgi:hypothetical protein
LRKANPISDFLNDMSSRLMTVPHLLKAMRVEECQSEWSHRKAGPIGLVAMSMGAECRIGFGCFGSAVRRSVDQTLMGVGWHSGENHRDDTDLEDNPADTENCRWKWKATRAVQDSRHQMARLHRSDSQGHASDRRANCHRANGQWGSAKFWSS